MNCREFEIMDKQGFIPVSPRRRERECVQILGLPTYTYPIEGNCLFVDVTNFAREELHKWLYTIQEHILNALGNKGWQGDGVKWHDKAMRFFVNFKTPLINKVLALCPQYDYLCVSLSQKKSDEDAFTHLIYGLFKDEEVFNHVRTNTLYDFNTSVDTSVPNLHRFQVIIPSKREPQWVTHMPNLHAMEKPAAVQPKGPSTVEEHCSAMKKFINESSPTGPSKSTKKNIEDTQTIKQKILKRIQALKKELEEEKSKLSKVDSTSQDLEKLSHTQEVVEAAVKLALDGLKSKNPVLPQEASSPQEQSCILNEDNATNTEEDNDGWGPNEWGPDLSELKKELSSKSSNVDVEGKMEVIEAPRVVKGGLLPYNQVAVVEKM